MKDRVCTWKNPIDIEFKKKKMNGISLSLKDYALLRKIKDYMVFLHPKPLHFSALFLYLDFSLLFSLFLTTFSSYSSRNVACYTRIGVSLSLLLTNPNIATTNTIPQLEEREKP